MVTNLVIGPELFQPEPSREVLVEIEVPGGLLNFICVEITDSGELEIIGPYLGGTGSRSFLLGSHGFHLGRRAWAEFKQKIDEFFATGVIPKKRMMHGTISSVRDGWFDVKWHSVTLDSGGLTTYPLDRVPEEGRHKIVEGAEFSDERG